MNISSLASTAAGQVPSGAAHSAARAADASGTIAPPPASAGNSPAILPANSAGANVASGGRELQQALEDVRAAIRPIANDLTFSIDEETGRTLIKIVDSQTDEVIRQIPSEELLRISKALDKLQGLLLRQEV